jgi:hypothetical protein
MRALRAMIVVLMAAQVVLVAAAPASAQVTDTVPCPAGIPDAGFADIDPSNIHKHDIDCIAFWEITTQVGTYDALGLVTRDQMALFLTRTISWVGIIPPGNPRGFEDVDALPVESQTAINQLAELSITTGISATTYAPYAHVTREQMALFLARTVRAAAADLPDGSDQGFVDLGALSAESQQAINQLRQLGITAGTTATTFDPTGIVNRQQMASFLARTLDVIWTFALLGEFPLSCNPPLGQNLPGTVCTGSGIWPAGRTFRIVEGYVLELPGDPASLTSTSFSLTVDGSPVLLREKHIILEGLHFRVWEASFPGGLTGNHTITGQWFSGGTLETTVTLTVEFIP